MKIQSQKNQMNKVLVCLGISLFSIGAIAQVTDFMPGSNSILQYVIVNDTDKGLDGSAFYEDKYEPGTIIEEGGKSFRAYLRYNALKDQVEVKVSPLDPEVYVLPRNEKFSYKLRDYTYILTNTTSHRGEKLDSYLMEHFSGKKASFFSKPILKVIKDRNEKSVFVDSKPPSMKINLDYYLGLNSEKLQKVRLKEKDFKNILPTSKEMKQYFDDHKIKDVEDVKKLLEFYESLKS